MCWWGLCGFIRGRWTRCWWRSPGPPRARRASRWPPGASRQPGGTSCCGTNLRWDIQILWLIQFYKRRRASEWIIRGFKGLSKSLKSKKVYCVVCKNFIISKEKRNLFTFCYERLWHNWVNIPAPWPWRSWISHDSHDSVTGLSRNFAKQDPVMIMWPGGSWPCESHPVWQSLWKNIGRKYTEGCSYCFYVTHPLICRSWRTWWWHSSRCSGWTARPRCSSRRRWNINRIRTLH